MRSVAHRLIELGRAGRGRAEDVKARQQKIYRKLMAVTRRTLRQADKVVEEVRCGIKKAPDFVGQLIVEAMARGLEEVGGLTRRVLTQTKARVLKGDTHHKDKLLSIFVTDTEATRKGKAAKPTEFGKLVKIQEADNQIITDYEVYPQRPSDQALLLPSIEKHKEIFERAPEMVAADAGFFSSDNEAGAKDAG